MKLKPVQNVNRFNVLRPKLDLPQSEHDSDDDADMLEELDNEVLEVVNPGLPPRSATMMPPAMKFLNMLGEIKQQGALRVGMWSFHPWAMQDKSGEWIGYEIDVARRLAKDFGVELDLYRHPMRSSYPSSKLAHFTSSFPALASRRNATSKSISQSPTSG